MTLADQRIVITGGTSGIGLAAARALAAQGARLVVASRSPERLAAAAAELGPDAEAVPLDVTDEAAVDAFFEQVGPFDHLVTTAGEQALDAPVLQLDTAVARRLFDVKYWGQYHAARHGAPRLRPGGSITLFSAWLARKPTAGFPTYAAIDGAIESLARVLALEIAPLRVNVVSPGVIDTPLYDNLPADLRRDVLAGVAAELPVKRIGTPEDVAKAVLYLIGNGFSTGAVVDVDGGHGWGRAA